MPGLSPKDAERTKPKLEKSQAAARAAEQEYTSILERLLDLHKRWQDEMKAACVVF